MPILPELPSEDPGKTEILEEKAAKTASPEQSKYLQALLAKRMAFVSSPSGGERNKSG